MFSKNQVKMLSTVGVIYFLGMAAIFAPKQNIPEDQSLLNESIVQTYEAVEETMVASDALSSYWHENIQRWEGLIVKHAGDIDPDLIAAIMMVESTGRPDAVSHSSAIGLLQIMPYEAGFRSRPTIAELFNPETNIIWGVKILQSELDYFDGDIFLALGAYYDGRGNAKNRTTRTVSYARKVLELYAAAKGDS